MLTIITFQEWCPPQTPWWNPLMVCWASFSKKKFNKIPPRSFQYRYWFMIQNLVAFNLTNIALVLVNPGGSYKFCNTYTMSLYHGDKLKSDITCNYGLGWFEELYKKFSCKDSQFEYVISLANPCPFTSFVGLISKSYSSSITIHLSLFPYGSGCVRICFTTFLGT